MINKMMTSQTLQTKHLPTILLYTIQMRGSVNQLLSLDGYNEHVPIIISILIYNEIGELTMKHPMDNFVQQKKMSI